ncbi:MAG: UDP-N-acetylmuramoyl-L-alanine--D-glutamate ligase [Thermodesulfovibrionales bacterium]
MALTGKRALVVGLARSGVGAANLLSSLGIDVTVTDKKTGDQLGEYRQQLSPSVKLSLGGYPSSVNGTDMVIVSPGVPLSLDLIVKAKEKGITVIGEFELAYQVMGGQQSAAGARLSAIRSRVPFLAVTGTNGKSTTTTLLDLMLKKAGFRTLLGGNIGNALTEEIYKRVRGNKSHVTTENHLAELNAVVDFVVAEVSSFQLESIEEFKPKGAAILNITPDHLDRYHSPEEYGDAKSRVFMNQDQNDFLVLNAEDDQIEAVHREKVSGKSKKPRVFYFSRQKEIEGVYCVQGQVFANLPLNAEREAQRTKLLRADEIKMKGVHNLENAMAASAMALLAGCRDEAVVEVLRGFPGLEHRMEFVRKLHGVQYINDSKGTNVGAVLKSLEGFSSPIILIAGGRDKAGDFTQMRPLIRERVKALVLIGEASEKMKGVFSDLTTIVLASDLKEAVYEAAGMAREGDVVLLSPACASFDMFRDFEDRGEQFKKMVMGLS